MKPFIGLDLLRATDYISPQQFESIHADAVEIIKINYKYY